jgi:hypothetical protein
MVTIKSREKVRRHIEDTKMSLFFQAQHPRPQCCQTTILGRAAWDGTQNTFKSFQIYAQRTLSWGVRLVRYALRQVCVSQLRISFM